jgi:hypothetical protein
MAERRRRHAAIAAGTGLARAEKRDRGEGVIVTSPAPIEFHIAFPAPWSICGDEVLDADGDALCAFDDEDAEELTFWQGIVDAVNLQDAARRERVMQAARAM